MDFINCKTNKFIPYNNTMKKSIKHLIDKQKTNQFVSVIAKLIFNKNILTLIYYPKILLIKELQFKMNVYLFKIIKSRKKAQ